MHHGLLLFRLKGLQYEIVFYEAARSACAWYCIIPFQRIIVLYVFVFYEATRNAGAWSFIIPFTRITVRIRILRSGDMRVHIWPGYVVSVNATRTASTSFSFHFHS